VRGQTTTDVTPSFEVLERDGLARIGRLTTPHGPIETPALLPVVHPDPNRQPISPAEMRRRLGVRAVITSAYIVGRIPPLRARVERDGIHGLLGFDGPIMTDSGAFQQHAYGSIEVQPSEILEFQNRIGTDIATVLDVFTEPDASLDSATTSLEMTLDRAREARRGRRGLLAVPVQGGSHGSLRSRAAAEASALGEVLAVGGVVPLMEQYRFPELAGVLGAVRPTLSPGAAVHLFGTGHPMMFAFAALFGVDLFDSAAYLKFARRGDLLFPDGTTALKDVRESTCHCFLCADRPLTEVAKLRAEERERWVAIHNLLASVDEIGRVRQAIRDGVLWELAERRAGAHPALRAGLAAARDGPEVFLPTEPESRRAFREVDPESRRRPSVVRFRRRVAVYSAGRVRPLELPRIPLRPEYLQHVPTTDTSGSSVDWQVSTPLGPVPLELTDLYPVGPYLGEEEFVRRPQHRSPSSIVPAVDSALGERTERGRDWTDAWTRRQISGLLEWTYGPNAAEELAHGFSGERSRRTGRLRATLSEGKIAFYIGTDGVPRPTFVGAKILHATLPAGRVRVVVADDAVPFVREGRTLFTRFVVDSDPALSPGSSALLVDRADHLLAVGRLLLAPHEIPALPRGVAAWVTSHARSRSSPPDETGSEPASRDGDRESGEETFMGRDDSRPSHRAGP